MYDEEGEQVWERSLDLNGKVINGSNAPCPFLYQGQYYDKEIELAYNRFRYYDPDDGRYISKDPIGLFSGENNLYSYVSDSNSYVDILGLTKTYKLSKKKFPEHVAMVENAIKKGHSLKGLKRGKGTKAARKNRYQSQKEIRKKQGGPKKDHDYDEYPYASTEQGGSGAHVEEVLSDVNQAAGRDLGKFYRENKIQHGDSFDIQIVE
ncbi:RHS repeat-associated core domain-containing protein [Tenacibaculum maritimum]|uniref:RHS repeat-associated core domain-containing protein n=3 Tax=Tenacibaculum maritimum TaxID=107401 RepID=UPI0012E464D5|nr:RHS repeat-associated core domain-containing protein [Tenacibaculum maritimum]CAA0156210.1 hypothetical protein USCSE301_1040003 [Tenacibaculum maritimum]